METLLSILSRWPGRRRTEQVLRDQGFRVPEQYRRLILAGCPCPEAEALDRYWDEVTMEHMASGGRASSDRRTFNGPTLYRSAYLDELFHSVRGQDLAEGGFSAGNGLAIDPCMRHWEIRSIRGGRTGAEAFRAIFNEIEAIKQEEAAFLKASPHGWSDRKTDIAEYFRQAAPRYGFARRGKWSQRTNDHGHALRCAVDTGGRPDCVNLPLIFEAVGPGENYYLWSSRLIPGFFYYGIFATPTSGALGVLAHLALFAAIADSLGFRASESRTSSDI